MGLSEERGRVNTPPKRKGRGYSPNGKGSRDPLRGRKGGPSRRNKGEERREREREMKPPKEYEGNPPKER